ncbi:hypothetical protein Q7P37_004674 [Cladosporium fusiforme]
MTSTSNADDTGPCSGNVIEFICRSGDHDSSLTVVFRTNQIHIKILGSNLEDSTELNKRYVHYIQIANGDQESQDDNIGDMFNWLLEGCSPQLSRLPPPEIPTNPTLDDYFNKNHYHFTLHATSKDEFKLEPTAEPSSGFHLGYSKHLLKKLDFLRPSFQLSEVTICADSPAEALSCPPRKVCTQTGGPYFFKHHVNKRELETYADIERAGLTGARISRLGGLVSDSGAIWGLLLNYIETDPYVVTLRDALKAASSPVREQWIEQVTTTLTQLHSGGVFWGDAKPENILIDTDNNAWIIDFGGGYTEGWVDENLAGTIEGDEQGLARIIEFMRRE